nr:nucleotidyltransferase family protein [Ruminococcus sp.]
MTSAMYTAGIVAEFDPFHKGHEYLLKQARERGATHIAVVMSGAAVQRGEIAVCSKHERAEKALRCGADLVIELPAPFSCSMAEYFAGAAVRILGQLNIDALCFGSEVDNADNIIGAARAVDELSDSAAVKSLLAEGLSYPAAVHAVTAEKFGGETAAALGTPNSTLGVEYVRALMKNGVAADILPIKRVGAGHDKRGGDYPSGSELRERLMRGEDISGGVPEDCVPQAIF